MALKEYEYGDRTYLFEEDEAPKGAKLIGPVKPSKSPGSFDELVMAKYDRKLAEKPANKLASKPQNKEK